MAPDLTGYVDLDHWLTNDAGPALDATLAPGPEPGGDAMCWTPTNPPNWHRPKPRRCPCPDCQETKP